jgi:hypothetical protein
LAFAFVAPAALADAEVERPHAFAFKIGYHVYPNSHYLAATQSGGIGGTQDFRGQSLELFDYSYQWPSRWSMNLSVMGGYYQKFTPALNSQHAIFVHTMTATPVYRIAGSNAVGQWLTYAGIGLGRYGLTARFDFSGSPSEEINTYTLGYQALIGMEYRFSEQTGFVMEEKFSRARIRFGRELERLDIDVGGHNILLGVRIHF